MTEELNPCPFCRNKAEHYSFTWQRHTVRCRYCLADCGEHDTPERAAFIWNTRPIEERLKAENDELRYIVEQFREWYNENGCPKKHNPDFLCSAEKEYKDDPETEGDFDETDCWKEEHEHGCWVEYYRWKFRQKNNITDTVKGEGMSNPFDPANKTCKEKGCVRLIGNHCHARDNGKFLLFGGREYPDCEFFEARKKPTLFNQITVSPEVLAETLVFTSYFEDCHYRRRAWKSVFFLPKRYETKEEAIAATVEKLKEVAK